MKLCSESVLELARNESLLVFDEFTMSRLGSQNTLFCTPESSVPSNLICRNKIKFANNVFQPQITIGFDSQNHLHNQSSREMPQDIVFTPEICQPVALNLIFKS